MNAIAYLLLAAAPAADADDQLRFDVQCMVATQQAAEQLEGALAMASQMASMFYFGRVDSHLPNSEVDERIAAAAKAIEGKQLGPLLEECGQFMQARGKAMEALGMKMDARDKADQLH